MKSIFKELTIVQLILLLLGLFEVVCVSFTFLKLDLTTLIIVYGMLSMVVLGYYIRVHGRHSFLLCRPKIRMTPVMVTALLCIAFQLYVVICYQHNDADDAWYVGTSVTTWQSGKLFLYSPYTGEPLNWANAKDYLLSPLPVFWAVLSKLMHVHPTVFCHCAVPVLMVCLAYGVYYMLGRELVGKAYVWYFVLFTGVLNMFGYYSTRTTGTFLLFRSWQGKAVYCAILLPLFFYYVLKVFQNAERRWIIGMILTSLASCMVSFSAVTLTPLLEGAMCLTYAVYKKDLKVPLEMACCVIPNVVLLTVYLMM